MDPGRRCFPGSLRSGISGWGLALHLTEHPTKGEVLKRHSEYVIVGSGFGGGFAALNLAKAGREVLVIERGVWSVRDDSCWDERRLHIEQPLYRGQVPFRVDQRKNGAAKEVWTNDTVGGASLFYGAASFRLREEDFLGAPVDGSSARDPSSAWPFDYLEMEPFYAEAEKLLGVAGVSGEDTTDPFRSSPFPQSPPNLSKPSQRIWRAAERLGLTPAHIPLAINFDGNSGKATCILCSTCDHFLCKIEAKNDLSVGVLPAAMASGAGVLSNTRVLRINAKNGRADSVEVVDQATGARETIQADHVIVAGGALASPHLLLASGIQSQGKGADLLGRNLMRHVTGVAAGILPVPANPESLFHKQVSISHFYHGLSGGGGTPPGPWGLIQAIHMPGRGVLKANTPRGFKTIAGTFSRFLVGLICIAEDVPQTRNGIFLESAREDKFGMPGMAVHHRYSPRDQAARKALTREAKKILLKAGALPVYTKGVETFSHALGTCKFGQDPDSSVLDPDCRVWGYENLYVVDSSFMPSGGSVNPSLTIAANSLRVTHAMLGR